MGVEDTVFFASADEFRGWLAEHGESERVLWVGYHRRETGTPSMTWAESVDEALCHGWIDGLRQRVDGQRYRVRFSPRRPNSNWSKRNLERVEALTEAGRMTPRGVAAYEARSADRSGYSVGAMSSAPPELPAAFDEALRANAEAWAFLEDQPPSYTNVALHWVMSAKREATRQRRLETLIADAANGLRIKPMRR